MVRKLGQPYKAIPRHLRPSPAPLANMDSNENISDLDRLEWLAGHGLYIPKSLDGEYYAAVDYGHTTGLRKTKERIDRAIRASGDGLVLQMVKVARGQKIKTTMVNGRENRHLRKSSNRQR